jgi:hypothetical protein
MVGLQAPVTIQEEGDMSLPFVLSFHILLRKSRKTFAFGRPGNELNFTSSHFRGEREKNTSEITKLMHHLLCANHFSNTPMIAHLTLIRIRE